MARASARASRKASYSFMDNPSIGNVKTPQAIPHTIFFLGMIDLIPKVALHALN